MLIHPWDAALDDHEWRRWLDGQEFGEFAVNHRGNLAPAVVPARFAWVVGVDRAGQADALCGQGAGIVVSGLAGWLDVR